MPASRTFERMFLAARQDAFNSDQSQWIAAGITERAVDGLWSMRSDSGAAILMHSGIPFDEIWPALLLRVLIEINQGPKGKPGAAAPLLS